MNRLWGYVVAAMVLSPACCAAQGEALPRGNSGDRTVRGQHPPLPEPAAPGYGTRRFSGYYTYRPRFSYERLVEHGAYSTSNTRYGFPLGMAIAGGFADVAAYPMGYGNPYAYRSPWYWNPLNAGAAATAPNPYPFQYPYAYVYPYPTPYMPYPGPMPYGPPGGGWNWYPGAPYPGQGPNGYPMPSPYGGAPRPPGGEAPDGGAPPD
jgi:hypothetical protein